MGLAVHVSFDSSCPACQKLGHCPARVLAGVTCRLSPSVLKPDLGVGSLQMHILGFQNRGYVAVFHTVLCCLNDREVL